MSKKQFTVTPQVERDIRAIANELPPIQKVIKGKRAWQIVHIPTLGKDIPLEARRPGDGVKPEQMYNYKTRIPVLANHYKELINRYKAGGEEQVEKYTKFVMRVMGINFKPTDD